MIKFDKNPLRFIERLIHDNLILILLYFTLNVSDSYFIVSSTIVMALFTAHLALTRDPRDPINRHQPTSKHSLFTVMPFPCAIINKGLYKSRLRLGLLQITNLI